MWLDWIGKSDFALSRKKLESIILRKYNIEVTFFMYIKTDLDVKDAL